MANDLTPLVNKTAKAVVTAMFLRTPLTVVPIRFQFAFDNFPPAEFHC